MDQDRFEDLESRIAFLDHTVQVLNDALGEQEKRIAQLEGTCQVLMRRLGELAQGVPANKPMDEKPPHY